MGSYILVLTSEDLIKLVKFRRRLSGGCSVRRGRLEGRVPEISVGS